MAPAFSPGSLYTHEEIFQGLSVGNSGGIRIAANTDGTVRRAVVLSTLPARENPYHDRIEGDVLVYTGAGQEGHQSLAGPNGRLLEQRTARFPIYAFRRLAGRRDSRFGPRAWEFVGLLLYLRHYAEPQVDARGELRTVWVMEFRILRTFPEVIPMQDAARMAACLASLAPDEGPESEAEDPRTPEPIPGLPDIELERVRERLLVIDPFAFEHLIKDILVRDGFEKVEVTRASQDGGIDVDAWAGTGLWPLRGLLLQVQAKRWLRTVGRKEVAELRGSLLPNAWGALVTTSRFSRSAITEASHPGKRPVSLIDGLEFSRLVARGEPPPPS